MKRIFAIVVLTIISLVTSCMMDTIDEVNKQYEEKIMKSKSIEKEKVTLNFNVINNAENITLKIKNQQEKKNCKEMVVDGQQKIDHIKT